MFWKKLASRAYETPTFELGFSGHELGRKKYQKLNVFEFLLAEIHVTIWVPRLPKKSKNVAFPKQNAMFWSENQENKMFFS